MKEVLATGGFGLLVAIVSAWLVEGGFRRRARRTIREEYELLALLPAESADRAALAAKVERRVHRYATPLRKRLGELTVSGRATYGVASLSLAASVVSVVAAVQESSLTPPDSDGWKSVLPVVAAIGVSAGFTWAIAEVGVIGLAEKVADLIAPAVARQSRYLVEAMEHVSGRMDRLSYRLMLGRRAAQERDRRASAARRDAEVPEERSPRG